MGNISIQKLLNNLNPHRSNITTRGFICHAIRVKGSECIPELLHALKDAPLWKLGPIIEILGDFHDPRALPSLLPLLFSDEVRIVSQTARAIIKFRQLDCVPIMLDALAHATNWLIKCAIAESLHQFIESNPTNHERLFRFFFDAYFLRHNREDYVLAKFRELGWNFEEYDDDPMQIIDHILQTLPSKPLGSSAWVLLRYFPYATIQLITLKLSLNPPISEQILLKHIYSEVLGGLSLQLPNSFTILL